MRGQSDRRNELLSKFNNIINPQDANELKLRNKANSIFSSAYANNAEGTFSKNIIDNALNVQKGISLEDIQKPYKYGKYTNNSDRGEQSTEETSFDFNANADENNLAGLDVATELPKLSAGQIGKIIDSHFSNSKVISSKDAQGIYEAQQKTGMSALAILGIGALESGWGTSNIANKTNNIWGYGATNKNPLQNAHNYSQMSTGALQFANEYMNTYYNKYGAKSIYSAGTGENPSKKGYAYNDNGTINSSWATNIGSIMKKLYNTAKTVTPTASTAGESSDSAYTPGKRIANTASYNNSAAKGQCVWYVRGRASEKLGKTVGALGNANQMWYNAKENAKLSATKENIKPNTIVSYSKGVTAAGQKAGHVIFIENVIGDTVYYTEGGSSYYKNGTDGVVKTATKEGILNGVNTSGGRMGSGIIGIIDLSKY